MSHFSKVGATYNSPELIRNALVMMGVSADEIVTATGNRKANTHWDNGITIQAGDIYVTQQGLKRIERVQGMDRARRAELVFKQGPKGYEMQADLWELGERFPSYFSAAYQIQSAKAAGLNIAAVNINGSDITIKAAPKAATQSLGVSVL